MNQIKSLIGRAGSRVLKMLDEGFDFEQVTEETAQRRLAICQGCDKIDGDQCSVCGCEVAFKVTLKTNPVLTVFKAEKTDNKCPAGKW